jgi:predicted DNA-binding transcriptional regulator AlpA
VSAPDRAAVAAVALYVTRSQLCARWGLSRATIYRMQADGHLPRPVRLGRGAPRWPIGEIERIEAQAVEDRGAGHA